MSEPSNPDKFSLQRRHAPQNACFGCGLANDKGLHLESYEAEEGLVATWFGKPEHEAFAGVLSGGIVGTLLDCHANWTAAIHLMRLRHLKHPPCTVTADFHVKLLKPTPSQKILTLSSRVIDLEGERVTVESYLKSGEQLTASCRGHFVNVKLGHPAYYRW